MWRRIVVQVYEQIFCHSLKLSSFSLMVVAAGKT